MTTPRTRILVSVRDPDEARIMLKLPIGVLDLKEPADGALGALDVKTVNAIVSLAGQRRTSIPVSATVGDLPPDPDLVVERVAALDATGVDYIKIGFFSPQHFARIPAALSRISPHARLIAVLFADRQHDLSGPCRLLSRAGFSGAMVDTADKARGSVVDLLDEAGRQTFVDEARRHHLLCGIAGSLRRDDVGPLMAHAADYLGFRSALCSGGRDQAISPDAARELVAQFNTLPRGRSARTARPRSPGQASPAYQE